MDTMALTYTEAIKPGKSEKTSSMYMFKNTNKKGKASVRQYLIVHGSGKF